jgi:predicted anti-sigma-YlaC factor YlaD
MGHWMFNCNEVSQKVSESMDRVLPFHQQMMIRFHLKMCKYCARFSDQLLLIRKAIRTEEDSDEGLKPSESSFSEPRERIKQALRDQLKKKSD